MIMWTKNCILLLFISLSASEWIYCFDENGAYCKQSTVVECDDYASIEIYMPDLKYYIYALEKIVT